LSKVVLFIVGLALLTVTGHYFFSTGQLSIVANPIPKSVVSPTIEPVVPSTEPIASQEIDAQLLTVESIAPLLETTPEPKTINSADSLRFALESVVEDSIEQDIWDEIDADIVSTR